MSNPFDNLSRAIAWRAWGISLWQWGQKLYRDCLADLPLLSRLGSHVGLLGLVVVTVLVGGIPLKMSNPQTDQQSLSDSDPGNPWQPLSADDFPFFLPSPLTASASRARNDLTTYSVQPGDTVTGIASQFGVSPDSILWANPKLEDNPDFLSLGQTLNIPPVSGVLYTVQNGDTLQKIVGKFRGDQSADAMTQAVTALDFNQSRHDLQAPNYDLTVGQFLMVPSGTKAETARAPSTTSRSSPVTTVLRSTVRFGWPVAGRITQGYWSRHRGIDIGSSLGTPIHAADSGTIAMAGWDAVGYGNMILINHGNGYMTRYGHLSEIDVQVGQAVQKGQVIGLVGSTGHSTGPHLHFEIIHNGLNQNPYGFLR
ncbi:MAG TPA: M23 family metallopeptidase [Anaerolineae bacterium]